VWGQKIVERRSETGQTIAMKLNYAIELAFSFEQVMQRLYEDLGRRPGASAGEDLSKLWAGMALAEQIRAASWTPPAGGKKS
jgi:hypothetical protein